MIHRRIEGIIVVILSAVFVIILPPFIIFVATDVLPINKDLTVEEFINTVVEDGSTYDYIQESDYILITEFKADSDQRYHLAFKGKRSGYIKVSHFLLGSIFTEYKIETKNGEEIRYTFKKHRGNYLLEFDTFQENISLYDNTNKKLDSLMLYSHKIIFEVLEDVKEDYKVYAEINNERFKVVDYKTIKSLAEDYEDKDFLKIIF